jgi:hypothetical protein
MKICQSELQNRAEQSELFMPQRETGSEKAFSVPVHRKMESSECSCIVFQGMNIPLFFHYVNEKLT